MQQREEQNESQSIQKSDHISQQIHACVETQSLELLKSLKEYANYYVLRQESLKINAKKMHTLKIIKEDLLKTYVADTWHTENKIKTQDSTYHLEPLLHTLVKKNWMEGVDFLLNHTDVNVNTYSYICAKESDGNFQKNQTALHIAVRNDHLPLVEMLLAKGAHANVSAFECSPLVECCLNPQANKNRTIIAQKLIEHNANVNATKNEELSPLKAALQQEELNQDILSILLNNANLNVPKLDKPSDFVSVLLKHRNHNEKLFPWLESTSNKVTKCFLSHPKSFKKTQIWEDFLQFYKMHLTYSPKKMVEEWVREYAANNNGENPFATLAIHRRTGRFSKFFNRGETRSMKAFKTYLKNERLPDCVKNINERIVDEALPLLAHN